MDWKLLAYSAGAVFFFLFGSVCVVQKKLSHTGFNGEHPAHAVVFFLSVIFTGAVYGVWHGFSEGYSFWPVAFTFGMILYTGLGISLGLHRLFTHKSFSATPACHLFLGVGAWMAGMRMISWIHNHELHHAHEDAAGDPHSPRIPFSGGLYGFLWSHILWLFFQRKDDATARNMARARPGLMRREKFLFVPCFLLGFVVPCALFGTDGLWLACIRVAYVLNIAFSINSAGHMFGTSVQKQSLSRNGSWAGALVTIVGERYHANHHADQRCAFLGRRWYDIDAGKWALIILEWAGVVRNVRRPKPISAVS